MRHPFNIQLLFAATTAASMILTGCRKEIAFFKHPGQESCAGCNIEQITVDYSTEIQTYLVDYVFTYNSAGDPVTVKKFLCDHRQSQRRIPL